MRASKLTLGTALFLLTVMVAPAQKGYDLFEQALVKERVENDLGEAIKIYERVVKDFSSNRPLVAKTLVQLGSAYEKQKDVQRARAVYGRVAAEFLTEADAVAKARERLAALDGRPSNEGLTLRVAVTGDDASADAFITPDGRFLVRPHWDTGDLAVRDMVLGKTSRMMAKTGTWDTGDDKDAEVDSAMLSPDQKWIAYVWNPPLQALTTNCASCPIRWAGSPVRL